MKEPIDVRSNSGDEVRGESDMDERSQRELRRRPRILFLSQCLPFPPHSGVTRRTYHILKELHRKFDVSLVPFSRRVHQNDDDARVFSTLALRREFKDVTDPVRINADYSLVERLRNHALSVLSRKPYIFFDYGSPRYGQRLQKTLDAAWPDLVHLDSLDLYRWLPELPSVPTACTHHNIESDLLRLQGDHAGPFVGSYMKHQANLLERVESTLAPRFDLNVMTSEVDETRLHALAPRARTAVIPNGVDVDYFRPDSSEAIVADRLVFLGPTYMFPNRDAVDFFLTESWPRVRQSCLTSTLHLVGKNSTEEKERFESHPAVTCNGHVPDIRPYLAEAAVSIVPIRVGGGTRLKILDAWAMGKAVVSTSVGCEGLATVDGANILIRDNAEDFAAAVIQLLRDAGLRERIGREARKTVERHYAWSVVGEKLSGLYENLIATRSQTKSEPRSAGIRA